MDIQGVARLAKVSTATVSRVINNSPSVRPAMAEHVKRIVEQTNYVPNRNARSLRVRHSKLFGLIVSDVKNPFFPELIDGFEAMATAHEIDVIFTHTNYDPKRLEHCLRRMVERNVDGIAVMTSEAAVESLAEVGRRNIPLILLDQAEKGHDFQNILTDFNSGFLEAVRHLKDLGHTEIGFVSGPTTFASVKRRREAFVRAMKINRLKVRKEWIVKGELQVEGGRQATKRLLAGTQRPSAIVTTNDLMAVGALQAAHEAGISVPRNLSVIGFDDLQVSAMVSPPLTTICMSRQEIAARAFSFLFEASQRHSKLPPHKRSILPRLVVRGSTAPPP